MVSLLKAPDLGQDGLLGPGGPVGGRQRVAEHDGPAGLGRPSELLTQKACKFDFE